jgi:hypothetical protein
VNLAERQQCVFSLIRYVPDPVKDEFVNIGVLLREQAVPERMELRFTRNWARVRCIDPLADVTMLEAMESEMREKLGGSPELMRALSESLSNVVQMTEPKACLAETFQTQMDQLMRLYVEGFQLPREQKRTKRVSLQGEMRRQFERAEVWGLMRKQIAVAQYTRAGDPLRIDCGYRPNGVIKMFQAVSLDSDIAGAKDLAYSVPFIAEGVLRLEKATLELTAFVEPIREMGAEQERIDRYRFGVETMERQQIRVLTVADMQRVAVAARQDLRLGS